MASPLTGLLERNNTWENLLEQNNRLMTVQNLPGCFSATEDYSRALGLPEGMTQLKLERLTRDSSGYHPSWLAEVGKLPASCDSLESQIGATLNDMVRKTELIDRNILGVDFNAIRNIAGLSASTTFELERNFGNVVTSYNTLANSIHGLQDVVTLPVFALPGAAREVMVATHVIRTCEAVDGATQELEPIDVEVVQVVETETSNCISLLRNVHPDLVIPYLGAREAFKGDNPDKVRHIVTSLRELWGNLLRFLAPDELVVKWAMNRDSRLLNEGKPTRNARVLYVCREIASDPLIQFVSFDAKAFVKMFEFFNSLHKLKHNLTDKDLRLLLLRTDSWIMYFLQIENEFN